MSIKHLSLIAVAAILGCAPASGTSSTPREVTLARKSFLITADEIAEAHADAGTAYDAIARLRPNWLVRHGIAGQGNAYAVVFVDGQQYGDLNTLRNIPAYQVGDVRYYDVTQAGATYGIKGDTGGVIEVRMRVRD